AQRLTDGTKSTVESSPATLLDACGRMCAGQGLAWDAMVIEGSPFAGIQRFIQPSELSVFGDSLPLALKGDLLRRASEVAQCAALTCPGTPRPVSRVLIWNRPHGLGTH